MRELGRFEAQGDDGHRYTVVVRVEVIDARTYDDPHATIDGLKELRLTTGEPVNFVDDRTFQVATTGVTLRAPAALNIPGMTG